MRHERFTFGVFRLDVADRRLSRDGEDVTLPPKAFDLLVQLVQRAGRLVTKKELLDAVWAGTFVEEGILAVHVSGIRKALGDDGRTGRYIQTVARSGYRFAADVTAGPAQAMRAPSASAAEVHELVGRARAHLMSVARSRVPAAIDAFEAAIAVDPACASAHAGLALAQCARAELRIVPPAEAYARARVSALRALALDDGSADARVALGAVMFLAEWDWIGAERSLQRALALDPHHTQGRLLYGHLLEALGRPADGLAMKLRALERDPFSPSVHLAIAQNYWHQRRYDDTIRWAGKTLELDPSHGLAREFLAGVYWRTGDFDRHMDENVKHAELHGVPAEALDSLRAAFAAGGRAGVVRLALQQAAAAPAGFPALQLALLHAELGDLDSALPCLERAIDGRDPCLVDLAVAPQWDALRSDPRFDRCVARMGLG